MLPPQTFYTQVVHEKGQKLQIWTWAPYRVQCPCLKSQHQLSWILLTFATAIMGTLSKTVRFPLYPSQWVIIITNFLILHIGQQFAKAFVRRQRWCCPQPCSVFSSRSTLYLANSSLMTGQPEGQGKGGTQRKGGFRTDNKERSIQLKAIMNVRKAIHWVPAILEG